MRIKSLIAISCFMVFGSINAQTFEEEIDAYQAQHNKEFKDAEHSPLTRKDRRKFKEHNFFPANEEFKVQAIFIKVEDPIPFKMKTSTDRLPEYVKYAEAIFNIKGKEYKLNIYQSTTLRLREDLKDHLFLLFTDLTSGESTYGAGRYIDLKIPEGDTIEIDFNKSYHPYCAYNHIYSCPIPPKENFLNLAVEAGIMNLSLAKKKKKKKKRSSKAPFNLNFLSELESNGKPSSYTRISFKFFINY